MCSNCDNRCIMHMLPKLYEMKFTQNWKHCIFKKYFQNIFLILFMPCINIHHLNVRAFQHSVNLKGTINDQAFEKLITIWEID